MLLRGSACGDETVPATVWGALAELSRRKPGFGQQAGRRRPISAVDASSSPNTTALIGRRWDAFAVQAKAEQKTGAVGTAATADLIITLRHRRLDGHVRTT